MKPTKPFTVIDGQRGRGTLACTWCAERFLTRADLEAHWIASKRCSRNKTVSNSTPSKYSRADLVIEQPGEATLNLVRSKDCKHEETRPLVDTQGRLLALECTYCYTQLHQRILLSDD